ncbi:MAG: 6-hydroxymethylpterin diphosphokinase MptE-like protein [Candidatus Helarchaeota archaeon]
MNWKDWEFYYQIIIKRLNINKVKDEESARILNELLKNRNDVHKIENKISKQIKGSDVIIYGCGPSLGKLITKIKSIAQRCVNIAADGAVSALLKNDIKCQINTTDLDGNIEDILRSNSHGTISIVHAHGDNIPLIRKYVPKFTGPLLGSVQVEPFGKLVNYGGFSDGDRGIFLADHFGARRIILIGFDFGDIVGEYSKPDLGEHHASEKKLIKLDFAVFLISELLRKRNVEILSLSKTPIIKGLKFITFADLKNLLVNNE